MARPRMFCRGGVERAGFSAGEWAASGSPRRPPCNAGDVHSACGVSGWPRPHRKAPEIAVVNHVAPGGAPGALRVQ